MIKLKHTSLIVISGLVWMGIGIYLLQLGLSLLVFPAQQQEVSSYPVVNFISHYIGSVEGAVLALVVFALYVGYLKGTYVLGKSARKGVERILSLPNPASILLIYSAKYYILLGAMMALGISIKYFGLVGDVRGIVDTIIGSALINGSMLYFRLVQTAKAS